MNGQEKSAVDSVVCFGACRLDVSNVQVWRDGHEVKLTGKAFAVLCYFVDRPGQLVTKDDLFAAAWPETVVSDATLASCIQEIRQALGDEAKNPRYIETVHRRGFRFIAAVVSRQQSVASSQKEEENQKPALSVVEGTKNEHGLDSSVQRPVSNGEGGESVMPAQASIQELQARAVDAPPWIPAEVYPERSRRAGMTQVGSLEDAPSLPITTTPPRRFRWWQVLLLVVVLVLGGGLAANWRLVRLVAASYFPPPVPEPLALPLPDKPSLVVLPFVNLSGDSNQEYFSDGITDDLINTLAQFPDLFVIARHSAFTYKGKTIKEQDVGRELGVRQKC